MAVLGLPLLMAVVDGFAMHLMRGLWLRLNVRMMLQLAVDGSRAGPLAPGSLPVL